ncbi:hypothetical protein ACRRTK_007408 [Alexandromys fortis]
MRKESRVPASKGAFVVLKNMYLPPCDLKGLHTPRSPNPPITDVHCHPLRGERIGSKHSEMPLLPM